MTDDNQENTYLKAVADALERMQIPPEDLFPYVEGLRMRYVACLQTLVGIATKTIEEEPDVVARNLLDAMGIKEEGNVSHETNEQDV